MNDWIVFLTSSKVILMAIFFLCAVVSVTGLEAIRMRMARAQREGDGSATESMNTIIVAAAIVFALVLATGGSGLFLTGRTFLNLTLTMFGFADLLVLSLLTWQFRSGLPVDDTELRRIAARDL
jgi:uncharacterized membrane protein